jgi:hypothetical protein
MKKAGNPAKMLFVSIWGMGGRRKREEGRGKKKEERGKRKEERGKRKEGRGKREECF